MANKLVANGGIISRGESNFINDPSTLASNTGYGDIVTFGTGSLTQGDVYFLKSTLDWSLADADAAASSTGMIAIAMGTSPADGMLIRGFFRHANYTFSNGDTLYLSSTAGEISSSAPTGTVWVRRVGYCVNATNDVIYFNPCNEFTALAG